VGIPSLSREELMEINKDTVEYALDALYSVLNVEGAAKAGSTFSAYRGLDIHIHFIKIRSAIAVLESAGVSPEWDR
jgi:hypothetical protein